jgi:hypothetical protein
MGATPVKHWWLTPVILATWETEIRRIVVRGQPRKLAHNTISKITRAKMNWRCGSCRRVLASQVQSPEFKLQPHQRQRERKSERESMMGFSSGERHAKDCSLEK